MFTLKQKQENCNFLGGEYGKRKPKSKTNQKNF